MSQYSQWYHPYKVNRKYSKRVAYFSMEFGIHQALKVYSGGLGYLAGSHMRSAYDLRQNLIGIGMLWKYGYYDQERHEDQTMKAHFLKKYYTFLEETGIQVQVIIHGNPVWVKALVLKPEVFGTVPVYLLTTDVPENDYISRTITHKLYDAEIATRIAQSLILGIGGAKVVEALGGADVYHMNEAHALPLAFHLYHQHQNIKELQKRLVFTTHTPEKAGNEEYDIDLLNKMTFFGPLSMEEARHITGTQGHLFNYTLAALRMAKVANGVSQLHAEVSRMMWYDFGQVCKIKAITNAQNVPFWQDVALREACDRNDDHALMERKKVLKQQLFEIVADQTGKLFNPEVLTIVWARRFAGYKRPDLLLYDIHRFNELLNQTDQPVQVIWAGKPYPFDHGAIETFNRLVKFSHKRENFAILTGYELELSRRLKEGADIWLNTPRRPREASGTSGMTAAMNGAINFSVQDGWIPEFGRHGENSFLFPIVDSSLPHYILDEMDYNHLMQILEKEVIPTYYHHHKKWLQILKQSMRDVVPQFDADRMADEYYAKLYKVT
jgi:glycogen phosphorylase